MENRLIRMKELASTRSTPGMMPMCAETIWAMVKRGKFPEPVKFSDRVTAWRMSDVNAYIEKMSKQQGATADDHASKKSKKSSKLPKLLQTVNT